MDVVTPDTPWVTPEVLHVLNEPTGLRWRQRQSLEEARSALPALEVREVRTGRIGLTVKQIEDDVWQINGKIDHSGMRTLRSVHTVGSDYESAGI